MSGQSGEPSGSGSRGVLGRRGGVRRWVGSVSLLGVIGVTGLGLTVWKSSDIRAADAAAASQPEPIETVTTAVAVERTQAQGSGVRRFEAPQEAPPGIRSNTTLMVMVGVLGAVIAMLTMVGLVVWLL